MSTRPAAAGDTRIDFEGAAIRCWAGDTIAAALLAAGEYHCRVTAWGEGRGIFCGMGVCQDCLVTVDGKPDQRACMTSVRDGMRIRRNPQRGSLNEAAILQSASRGDDTGYIEPEVLIVGAGPAGLNAAAVAAELGAEVVLLDERETAGGQFFKPAKSGQRVPRSLQSDRQAADGRRLTDRVAGSGTTLVPNALVWGVFDDKVLAVSDGAGTRIYRPQRLIVAAGAYERGVPLPGWTLPGVMTTGAAQTLMRSHGVAPGHRILVAGNGPLNFQVALELSMAGAEVVALLELAKPIAPRSSLALLAMFGSAPGLALKGMRLLAGLHSARVPVWYEHGIATIEATERGLRASFGRSGPDGVAANETLEVDAVCMGFGFLPNNELLRLAGCKHYFDPEGMQLRTERNPDCETSRPGIYAIGDCCGLGGAPAAMQEGIIAATAALESMRLPITPAADQTRRNARRQLRRQRAFQSALWSMYRAPRFDLRLARPDTPICRCENVTLSELDAALADGLQTLPAIKRCTRLGMGACQGRYCAPIAMSRLVQESGLVPDEYAFFAPRAPVKPISVHDLINIGGS